jgi:1-acyl-sn-glycerol-3-phosphate acyltransferase
VKPTLSILFWIYFALSSMVLFAIALPLWLATLPFDRNGRLLHQYSCFWAAHYLYVNPLWRITVEKTAPIDRARRYVIVANHQSFADILVLYATYLPFKWVSKSAVFNVPFIGWHMYLNRYVSLKRGDKASIEKMAARCRAWLDRGVSVLIFPEGTRSQDGRLGPFKLGAFRLAREAGVEVLPIVVDGTAEALPKHGLTMATRADCRVRVLEPLSVAADESDQAAADRVRDHLAQALDRLRQG